MDEVNKWFKIFAWWQEYGAVINNERQREYRKFKRAMKWRDYQRGWYAKNRERVLERQRLYRLNRTQADKSCKP